MRAAYVVTDFDVVRDFNLMLKDFSEEKAEKQEEKPHGADSQKDRL